MADAAMPAAAAVLRLDAVEPEVTYRPLERAAAVTPRVPGATQRAAVAKRCFAEPEPYQAPAFVTAPALQRTTREERRAALRPGHETANSDSSLSCPISTPSSCVSEFATMPQRPRDLADRMSQRREPDDGFLRETFTLPRLAARARARAFRLISRGRLHEQGRELAGTAGRRNRIHHAAAEKRRLNEATAHTAVIPRREPLRANPKNRQRGAGFAGSREDTRPGMSGENFQAASAVHLNEIFAKSAVPATFENEARCRERVWNSRRTHMRKTAITLATVAALGAAAMPHHQSRSARLGLRSGHRSRHRRGRSRRHSRGLDLARLRLGPGYGYSAPATAITGHVTIARLLWRPLRILRRTASSTDRYWHHDVIGKT